MNSVDIENNHTVDVSSIICRGIALRRAGGLKLPYFVMGVEPLHF